MILYNMIFKAITMSVLLGTNMAHELSILLNVFKVLLLAITVYLLHMLVQVILLRERMRALWADMRFCNARFWCFLSWWFIFTLFMLFHIFLLLL